METCDTCGDNFELEQFGQSECRHCQRVASVESDHSEKLDELWWDISGHTKDCLALLTECVDALERPRLDKKTKEELSKKIRSLIPSVEGAISEGPEGC